MIVDDETDLLGVIAKMLEESGFSVHAFDSPERGLEHVKNGGCKDCSIVVSDIRMPGMTGFQFVRHLKELRPEMKIILMTAFKINMTEAQMVLPSTKVDAFLGKPFKKADLMEAIKNAVSPNIVIN